MNILKKLTANSFLVMVLFGLLFLPIGAIGLANINSRANVLSAQDARNNTNQEPTDNEPSLPTPTPETYDTGVKYPYQMDFENYSPSTPQSTQTEVPDFTP